MRLLLHHKMFLTLTLVKSYDVAGIQLSTPNTVLRLEILGSLLFGTSLRGAVRVHYYSFC